MELDKRKAAILRAIVEQHVATAQPVGSQAVAGSSGMNVSSATVRNEMTVLEHEGYIEKGVRHLAAQVVYACGAAAGIALDTQLNGARWAALPEFVPTGNPAADELGRQARDALSTRGDHEPVDPLYIGGASRLAAEQEAFATTATASRLLELLEHQVELVALVQELLAQGPTVSIGSENSLDDLRDCSIVVAPYRVDGEVAGTVGVLGPTRMDYRQALAAVEAISEQLGRV